MPRCGGRDELGDALVQGEVGGGDSPDDVDTVLPGHVVDMPQARIVLDCAPVVEPCRVEMAFTIIWGNQAT